jgi:hypothetical protein
VNTDPNRPRTEIPRSGARPGRLGSARAQLTIVEHALCPLDPASALKEGLVHKSEFFYVDANRHTRKATARVLCPFGLSPGDEFYLWGLIALTLAQPEPSLEFYATPHYCLRELGLITRSSTGERPGGGKTYALFRQSVARLAAVTYVNDHFYDPVRGEHRDVAFGFLSYSLPIDPASSRAWRIVWDPIFFEVCQAARGSLLFDIEMYRSLDFASRRLFLLLKKIFWRNAQSPVFDLRHLGVNLLGFAPSLDLRDLKIKIARSALRLEERGIIEPVEPGSTGRFEKKKVGTYTVRFRRGSYFTSTSPSTVRPDAPGVASPLVEPLRAIGFGEASISHIILNYNHQLIQVWADITIAAGERSPSFFKVSPEAYFLDNIEKASKGARTPPDWWYEHRKEAERRDRESKRLLLELPEPSDPAPEVEVDEEAAFDAYLEGEGRAVFAEVLGRLLTQFLASGRSRRDSERTAIELARTHLRNRFQHEYAGSSSSPLSGPPSLGKILKDLKRP